MRLAIAMTALGLLGPPLLVIADEAVYRYEGKVLPYDPSAGWVRGNACDDACSESVQDGRYVTVYVGGGSGAYNNHLWVDFTSDPPPPPTFWVEWRHRTNHVLRPGYLFCNAYLDVRYGAIFELVYMYTNAAVSTGGTDVITGLVSGEFHTFRFESYDGVHYTFAADGQVFVDRIGTTTIGPTYVQMIGSGACGAENLPAVNEWDFVRWGTLDSDETIVAAQPPMGYVSARTDFPLDRFAVNFDAAYYAYLDDIAIEIEPLGLTPVGPLPQVIRTWRREGDGPETLEVVLDRPIPMNAVTRFTFTNTDPPQTLEYTFAPGDSDGDGDVDLSDTADFMNCFGHYPLSPLCQAFDTDGSTSLGWIDFATFWGWFLFR